MSADAAADQMPIPQDVPTIDWFLAELAPEQEVTPGLTVQGWRDFLDRPATPDDFTFEHVTYGTGGGRPLKAWVYRPQDPAAQRRPAVVFIHGGGWQGGHPWMHVRQACDLAALGYVTATISYRLYPETTMLGCVEDAKCAVRWVRAHADELGVDPDRIAVAGASAGGHLAAMVATTPGSFEGAGGWGDVSSEVATALLWYPATDLRVPLATWPNLYEEVGMVLGDGGADDGLRRTLSPVHHVGPTTPPTFTMTGDLDTLTTLAMIREHHDALDANGVENRLEVFEGRDHAFDQHPSGWEPCFDLTVEWLAGHL